MKLAINGFQATRLIPISFLLFGLLQLNGCGGGGTASELENTTSFSGVAQKGPFSSGSEVRIQQLTEQGKPTSYSITTVTTGRAADFSFTVPESWQLDNKKYPLQLTVKGNFLDESFSITNTSDVTATSQHEVTLNTLLQEPSNTSINLLTHWTSLRAKFLMLRERKDVSTALTQATNELQQYSGIAHSSELDFSQSEKNSSDNLQLLLLSGALLEVAKDYNQSSQFVINQIAVDFAEDGTINQQGKAWFKRIQAKIQPNPESKTQQYAKILANHLGKTIDTTKLPNSINIASRPQALAPQTIIAETGQTITLNGNGSLSANGGTLQYTWVRIDHQSHIEVPVSNRFIANPTIITPNQPADLLFALFVIDDQHISDTTLVKVSVSPPQPDNLQPIATPKTVITNEDTPVAFILQGTDPDGDNVTFDVGTTPILLDHGLLEGVAPNLTYTPNQNQSGTDHFNFTVSDGSSTSTEAGVTITVDPVNDKPIVFNKNISTNENTPVTVTLIDSGSDVDTDLNDLTITLLDQPDNGSVVIHSTTDVQFTPGGEFFGSDSFTYQISDGELTSEVATVSINVISVNDEPNAVSPSSSIAPLEVNQDTELQIALGGIDPEGNPITFELASPPANGGLFINGSAVTFDNGLLSGTPPNLTYKPYSAFVGNDTFKFLVRDSDGLASAEATVHIRVLKVNIQPVADYKAVTTNSNTAVAIELTGSDGDGDTLSFINIGDPAHGTLSGTAPNISYSPHTNFIGLDAFSYEVSDGTDVSDTALVEITVNNQAPTANAGEDQTIVSGTEVTLNGSGTDPEDDVTSAYTWSTVTGVDLNNTTIANPTFTAPTVTATTTYTYSLAVTDNNGLTSDVDTVNVAITPPLNLAPTANAGIDQTVLSGETVVLNGSASTDLEDITASIYSWIAPIGITLSDNAVVTPTFTAPTVLSTTSYTFKLKVTDSQGLSSIADSVIITVTPVNQAPIANAGADQTVTSGTEFTLNGSGSDPEDGTTSSFEWSSIINGVPQASSSSANPTFTAPIVSTITTLTYSLVVTDSEGLSSVADTVNITVEPFDISQPFVMKIKSIEEDFIIPTYGTGYDFYINCDSDNSTTFTHVQDSTLPFSCTYANQAIHKISIVGDFPRIDFLQGAGTADVERSREKLLAIEQWGNIAWDTMKNAFYDCDNLTITALDTPNLNSVENMSAMFKKASNFNNDISHWNVSNVNNMSSLFKGAAKFNQDISSWDVSNVTDMSYMFYAATDFDQNLGRWDIRNVGSNGGDMIGIFQNKALSTANYDRLLIGWSYKLHSELANFSAGHSQYSAFGILPRLLFVSKFGLGFDGGLANKAPTANAGVDQTVSSGSEVILNGSGTDFEGGTTAIFKWEPLASTSIVLSDSSIANPSFIAPTVASPTTYEIRLVVTDSEGRDSDIDSILVTVNP